ncbi:sulfate adenylyltransferase subunit 1 [Derxia lacustris]|uniref:sulfate adenylyltransferase subunit 1 n=1 Tax=Derxia lacustris TaxID=764842 RepID=UPI000A172878|nr:GTP-binding protein [Derxia lacustris]
MNLHDTHQDADLGVLRFLTCGSVDDGKSTLIGRLLYDTKTILDDTIATLERNAKKKGLSAIDLSLLTDGLTAEREQGITIDVAYRYFATPTRKFIIGDAPGHEQYTRNMVTAASTADVAILLVDARKGILPQTRRHATIASLLGIGQLIVAVNKMDLVGYDQAVFDRIDGEFREWLALHATTPAEVHSVPLSALEGAMVVNRGVPQEDSDEDAQPLGWYTGPTLLELLEAAPSTQLKADAAWRFPVQWVCRPSQSDFRGYAGRIEEGTIAVGDEIVVLPSGRRSKVVRIGLGEAELAEAFAGQSVMLSLADEVDISRGDMFVKASEGVPEGRQQISATVSWLGHNALDPRRSYILRHTSREVKAKIAAVESKLDLASLTWSPSDQPVALNDIAKLSIKTQQPLVADAYAENRVTGSFILIDEATNDTVAAGLIA